MTVNSNKILFVDDDESQRKLMKNMFLMLGYDAEFAKNAKEALAKLEQEEFSLIITDLIMPGMDGSELCKQIRAINSTTVIYALSGYLTQFEPEQFEEIGFDGHLGKPVDIDKLKRSVEGAFSKIAQGRL